MALCLSALRFGLRVYVADGALLIGPTFLICGFMWPMALCLSALRFGLGVYLADGALLIGLTAIF